MEMASLSIKMGHTIAGKIQSFERKVLFYLVLFSFISCSFFFLVLKNYSLCFKYRP